MKQNRQSIIVAVDSMTLVWGKRKKGNPDKVKHAKYLFQGLNKQKAQIIVPSIVVAEFVTPLATTKLREEMIIKLQKRFLLAPFDANDAAIAAELWNDGKSSREMKQSGVRVRLKADARIVATAYGHGAQVFYTDDDDCFNMAQKIMQTRKLPTIGTYLWPDMEQAEEDASAASETDDDEQSQN
jgi:predicted nucleic acid-binding protein